MNIYLFVNPQKVGDSYCFSCIPVCNEQYIMAIKPPTVSEQPTKIDKNDCAKPHGKILRQRCVNKVWALHTVQTWCFLHFQPKYWRKIQNNWQRPVSRVSCLYVWDMAIWRYDDRGICRYGDKVKKVKAIWQNDDMNEKLYCWARSRQNMQTEDN